MDSKKSGAVFVNELNLKKLEIAGKLEQVKKWQNKLTDKKVKYKFWLRGNKTAFFSRQQADTEELAGQICLLEEKLASIEYKILELEQ